jgi:hypothetical protein
MAYTLSNAQKGSVSLFKALEASFIKHRKAINALGYSNFVANSMINNGTASPLLIAAMQDPDIEIPVKSLPKMNIHEKKMINNSTAVDVKVHH